MLSRKGQGVFWTIAISLLLFWSVYAAPTDTYLIFSEQSDGNVDYLDVDAAPPLDLTGGSFTLSAWINPSGWGDNDQGRILDHGGGSSPAEGWSFHLENKLSTGKLQALRIKVNNDSTFFGISDANSVSIGVWQHVAVTVEEQLLTFYVNGVLAGTQSNVPTPNSSGVPIRIGARATDFARGFDGSIDDVRIWNRALSQSEIQSSMNTEISGSEVGLLAYYRIAGNPGNLLIQYARQTSESDRNNSRHSTSHKVFHGVAIGPKSGFPRFLRECRSRPVAR